MFPEKSAAYSDSNNFDNSRKGAASLVGRLLGQVPEWSKGADLRSAVQRTRGFEPHPVHLPY